MHLFSSHNPQPGMEEHCALREERTYFQVPTEVILLACPKSQPARGGADIRASFGSTSPAEPASPEPKEFVEWILPLNTNQASFPAPHARQPKQTSPLMGPHIWPKLLLPKDKFTKQAMPPHTATTDKLKIYFNTFKAPCQRLAFS